MSLGVKDLYATPVFLREYRKAGPGLATAAEREAHELVVRMRSQPSLWPRSYQTVKGIDAFVIEIDLAGGPRMLAHVNGVVTLCRMGDHEIIRRSLAGGELLAQVERGMPAPPQFLPETRSSLLPPSMGDEVGVYSYELAPEWIYWLDDEQAMITDRMRESLVDALLGDTVSRHLVLGGPGTGKTVVLTKLLQELSSADPRSRETWDVRFVSSPSLREYISLTTGWDLSSSRQHPSLGTPDVVLVDDPASLEEVVSQHLPRRRSLVVAMDPLQLDKSVSDTDLKAFMGQFDAVHWLTACYRQKEIVGGAARHVMEVVAQSSPYLDKSKKKVFSTARKVLTQRANTMSYPNLAGRVRTIEASDLPAWNEHFDWLCDLSHRGQLISYWPPLLIAVDDQIKRLPRGWGRRLDDVRHRRIKLSELGQVKGLEFQHVVVVLAPKTHQSLHTGFEGSGTSKYNQFRLMRIPFTRARDSIATFVVDPSPGRPHRPGDRRRVDG